MAIKINKLSLSISKSNFKQDKKGLSRIILTRDFFNKDTKLPEIFALLEFNAIEHISSDEIIAILDKIETKITERIQKIYNSINERKSFQTDNLSENLLELILKSLNGEIKFILEGKDDMEILAENLNLFIGILEPFVEKNEQKYYLHFAHYNRVNGLLVYKVGEKFKLMSIFGKAEKEEESESRKFFSNIISGKLDSDCFLIITNQNVLDHVIPDKIKQLVISMDIGEAVKNLKKMLTEVDGSGAILDFATIFIYLDDVDEKRNLTPENSIERLIKTEKNTERFLTPSIVPELKIDFGKFRFLLSQKIKNFYLALLRISGKIFHVKTERRGEKNETEGKENLSPEENKSSSLIMENNAHSENKPSLFSRLRTKIASLFSLFFNILSKIFVFIKKVIFFIPRRIILFLRKAKNTPGVVKIVILILILSAGFLYYGLKKEKAKKVDNTNDSAYQQSLTEINEKLNTLEAYIIYGNLESANAVIADIKNMLDNKFPKNNQEREQKYNEIKMILDEKERKINKTEEIDKPAKLAINTDGKIDNLILDNKKLILFSFSQKKIIIYDLDKRSQADVNISDEIFSNLRFPTLGKNGEIVLYSQNTNKFYSFNLKQRKLTMLNKTVINKEVKDVKLYANNTIYSLENNEIYTYKTSSAQLWFNTSPNIGNTKSFAIDGNIYILNSKGEISKFYKGDEVEFNVAKFMPALTDSGKIFTTADYKYLYILDPQNKRIVILDKECNSSSKTCSLVSQYASPSFINISDFAIDEKGKKIYLINGNSEIIEISIK